MEIRVFMEFHKRGKGIYLFLEELNNILSIRWALSYEGERKQ